MISPTKKSLPVAVVDQSERVIASNVFEEQEFPSMAEGRVALLGDGRFEAYTYALDIQ